MFSHPYRTPFAHKVKANRLSMCLVLFSGWCLVLEAANEPLWHYLQGQVHLATERQHFSYGKKILAEMRASNEQRFLEEGWPAIVGKIAERESMWDTARRAYMTLPPAQQSPQSNFAIAECLEKMGQAQQLLEWLGEKNRSFSLASKWRRYAMQARANLQLGNTREARKLLQRLAWGPRSLRPETYLAQASLEYENGNKSAARKAAAALQTQFRTSDEALSSVNLQMQHEGRAYLAEPEITLRHAMVYYKNRDFDRSDEAFTRILQEANPPTLRDKARYFLCMTELKRERPETAVKAFAKALPLLSSSPFGDRTAYQYARTLFMLGQDKDLLSLARGFNFREMSWRWETMELEILALRRLGDIEAFNRIENQLPRSRKAMFVRRHYYKNALLWAYQRGEIKQARSYMQKYRRTSLHGEAHLEALVWQGIIYAGQGQSQKAFDDWFEVLDRDPNHYFGLIALRQIETSPWRYAEFTRRFGDRTPALLKAKELRHFYYLTPNPQHQAEAGKLLLAKVKVDLGQAIPTQLMGKTQDWAKIGRPDWAASALSPKIKTKNRARYFLMKAQLYAQGGDLHSSILYAELLKKTYPNWLPLALVPQEVQALVYPRNFNKAVTKEAHAFNVDPHLILAIMREESRFDPNAKSGASARGLMQFIPSTAERLAAGMEIFGDFNLNRLYEPETAIKLGAKYLRELNDRFKDHPIYTVAAYNAGERAVDRWQTFAQSGDPLNFAGEITYKETRNYCHKVLGSYHHYLTLYGSRPPQLVAMGRQE